MSSDASTNAGQTPRQEAWDRALEQLPAWGIPHLVGIEHLRSMLSAARGRVRDSHRMQMQTLAKTTGNDIGDAAADIPGADDMGGITVAGDTTINITPQPAANQPAAVATAVKSRVWPIVLAAAMSGGIGAAAPLLYWWLNKPTPQPAAKLPDYQLRLEVKDQP